MNPRSALRAALVTSLLLALPQHARAYLDPGTGSAIVQGVIAAISALLVTGHMHWARLRNWLRSLGKRNARTAAPDDDVVQGQDPANRDASDR